MPAHAIKVCADLPASLDAITQALAQSKSHVSVQIRGLVLERLVRRLAVRLDDATKGRTGSAFPFL